MKYYFKIADIKISMEVEEEILWNSYIREFLSDPFENPDEVYECVFNDLPKPQGQLVYNDDFQQIYKGKQGEERLHFFYGQKEPCMLYRELSDKKVIILNNLYRNSFLKDENYSIFNAMAIEKVLLKRKALILHSSYIVWNGHAILFTAPSGTGKSTQADLWKKYNGAEIINGDRSVLYMKDGKVYAAGMPVCGSSNICKNVDAPVLGFVYLSQAKENHAERLDYRQTAKNLISETTIGLYDRELSLQVLDMVEEIASKVPMYHLACTKDQDAVIALQEALKEN